MQGNWVISCLNNESEVQVCVYQLQNIPLTSVLLGHSLHFHLIEKYWLEMDFWSDVLAIKYKKGQ